MAEGRIVYLEGDHPLGSLKTWKPLNFNITFPGMPGAGMMIRVVGLGYYGPEFKSCSAVEFIPGGVDSACHPSEVGKI